MRTLKFNVRAQRIEKDPACDFKDIVACSEGYLQARFKVDDAWKGCRMAADFQCNGEVHGEILQDGVCMIPSGALTDRVVGVRLKGMRKGYSIQTGWVYFRQEVS